MKQKITYRICEMAFSIGKTRKNEVKRVRNYVSYNGNDAEEGVEFFTG